MRSFYYWALPTESEMFELAFLGAVLTKFLQDLRKKMVDARDEKFEWRLKIWVSLAILGIQHSFSNLRLFCSTVDIDC